MGNSDHVVHHALVPARVFQQVPVLVHVLHHVVVQVHVQVPEHLLVFKLPTKLWTPELLLQSKTLTAIKPSRPGSVNLLLQNWLSNTFPKKKTKSSTSWQEQIYYTRIIHEYFKCLLQAYVKST